VVRKVKDEAVANEDIVKQTIAAMAEIQTSSTEIAKITDVLEDIAFQTNLLALNAGVEAARAGDAGKGFAVVASEVRGLAQRATEAAKEISQLIARSGASVENGAALVDRTGAALREILTGISQVTDFVGEIATTSAEQSKGISDINGAVADLDQTTQQNAAMFEETTAASLSLRSEAEELGRLISVFDFGVTGAPSGGLDLATGFDPSMADAETDPFESGNWALEAAPGIGWETVSPAMGHPGSDDADDPAFGTTG
jgi:methyl-accepting chemotaxis protein